MWIKKEKKMKEKENVPQKTTTNNAVVFWGSNGEPIATVVFHANDSSEIVDKFLTYQEKGIADFLRKFFDIEIDNSSEESMQCIDLEMK